jgi:hypothetical protein
VHHYWHTPKEKKPTHEWIFTDEGGKARFMHDGDTIIPGAGVRWKHVHRAEPPPPPPPAAPPAPPEASSCSSVTAVQEDSEDELPWQVIAILDVETVQDLLWSSKCRKDKVRAAKAGRTAEPPAAASLEGAFTPGAWLFRVTTAGGVALLEGPDESSAEAGRRECGEYLKVGGGVGGLSECCCSVTDVLLCYCCSETASAVAALLLLCCCSAVALLLLCCCCDGTEVW